MAYLGSLSGPGRLIVDGKAIGKVDYVIRIYQHRYLKQGRGTLKLDKSAYSWLFQKPEPPHSSYKTVIRSRYCWATWTGYAVTGRWTSSRSGRSQVI
jgi:hypothetical protein